MNSFRLALLAVFTATQQVFAAPPCPAYVVVRPTTQGPVRPAPAQSYAYGWFGAQSRSQHYGQSSYKRDWNQKVLIPGR